MLYEIEICAMLHSAVKFRQNVPICCKRTNNCNTFLICDMAKNLIAIKELCLMRHETRYILSFQNYIQFMMLWEGNAPPPARMLVSVNFGCFVPSSCGCYHCNAMRKAIKSHVN